MGTFTVFPQNRCESQQYDRSIFQELYVHTHLTKNEDKKAKRHNLKNKRLGHNVNSDSHEQFIFAWNVKSIVYSIYLFLCVCVTIVI